MNKAHPQAFIERILRGALLEVSPEPSDCIHPEQDCGSDHKDHEAEHPPVVTEAVFPVYGATDSCYDRQDHYGEEKELHSRIAVTTPAPIVLPPSRTANLRPTSRATGSCSDAVTVVLSPGMIISTPSLSLREPVTSVVPKKN